MEDKECCGTCNSHTRCINDDWVCKETNSESYGLYTMYDDYCEEYTEREKK